MAAKNKKVKVKEPEIPRILRQKEIDVEFGKILEGITPYAVGLESLDDLAFESQEDKETFVAALNLLSQALRALFRLHTVCEEMIVVWRMAKVYPWNPRSVSRSQHLHFMWVLFVNLCYAFEEKFKLAANEHNNVLKIFKHKGGIDVAAGMKK